MAPSNDAESDARWQEFESIFRQLHSEDSMKKLSETASILSFMDSSRGRIIVRVIILVLFVSLAASLLEGSSPVVIAAVATTFLMAGWLLAKLR